MGSINSVVSVVITKGTRAVPTASFNVPLIIGSSNRMSPIVGVFNNLAGVLSAGYEISDPEYIAAETMLEQSPTVASFLIGKNTASVAQVDTLAVGTLASGHTYLFDLNGTPISYLSTGLDTEQSILAALLTAIGVAFPSNPPVTGVVTGSGPGALLTLTASVPGAGFTISAVDADMTHVALTPNHSLVTDLIAIQAVNDSWYGLISTSQQDGDILQIAAYIETQSKIYGASSSEAGILTSVSTDIASELQALSYTRTFLLYSAQASSFPEAGWIGEMLTYTPGTANWKFKPIVGIVADNLNPTQISNAQGKGCNLYIVIGGVAVTVEGVMAGGQYIDFTIFLDWLVANIQSGVFSVLVNSPKVPFTNKGIVSIENPIGQVLQIAQNNGAVNAGWTVTAPDISQVPSADKIDRTLNNVVFTAVYTGAINKVNIQGFVSF